MRTDLAFQPHDRDALIRLVGEALQEKYSEEPDIDDDGDFSLVFDGTLVWVRVNRDEPAVEVFTRVTTGVCNQQQAARELAILNRDHRWDRWSLRVDHVWQFAFLPGGPFVPAHLDGLLDNFVAILRDTQDDLVFRPCSRG